MDISFPPLITVGTALLKFFGTLFALGVLLCLWKVLCETFLGMRYRLPPDGPRTALYSPILGRMPEMTRCIDTYDSNIYFSWLLGVDPRPACLRSPQKDKLSSSDDNYKGDMIKDYEREGRCVMFTVMGKKFVLMKDPALAKRMFDDIKAFPTRDHSTKLYLGPGLNSFDAPVDKLWKVHRSIVMQSMTPRSLDQYSEEIGQVGLELCKMLQPSHVKSFLQDLKKSTADKQSNCSRSHHESIADLVHQYLGDGEKEFLPQSLNDKAGGAVHIRDGLTLMKRVTFSVLCRTVLGKDWNEVYAAHVGGEQKTVDTGRLLKDQEIQLRFGNQMMLFPPWIQPLMKYLSSETKPAMEANGRSREVLLSIVRQLRQEYGKSSLSSSEGSSERNAKVPPATFAATLALHEENLDEEDVISELFIIMIAGHETTANALTFTLCCLGLDPQCRRVCFEHACSVLGVRGGASASPKDIYKGYREGRLFWIHAVLREACRLFPIAPAIPRLPPAHVHGFDSAADRKEKNSGTGGGKGFTIPSGSFCVFSAWAAGRSEEYFGPDVMEFRPERWLTAEETAEVGLPVHPHPVPSEYRCVFEMGFGGGQRICPGKRFAEEEAVMLLTQLILAFDFTLTGVDGSAEKLPQVVADLETHSPNINAPKYPISSPSHQGNRKRNDEKEGTL